MSESIDAIQRSEQPLWFITANPEILLEAKRDPVYRQTLTQADVRLVDGFGVWCALRLQGERPTRVTGVDFAEELVKYAADKQWKVALLGGASTHAAAHRLRARYPDVRILSEEAGRIAHDGETDERTDEAMSRITLAAPDILLVGFGHPKQERWIAKHIHDFPSVRVWVGVGGTFDMWAGSVPRAPRWLRALGGEWLWRLIHEPHRMTRIIRAVILFPIQWFIAKFRIFR